MKLGRMMYNHKRQIPFEDEMNRFDRTLAQLYVSTLAQPTTAHILIFVRQTTVSTEYFNTVPSGK